MGQRRVDRRRSFIWRVVKQSRKPCRKNEDKGSQIFGHCHKTIIWGGSIFEPIDIVKSWRRSSSLGTCHWHSQSLQIVVFQTMEIVAFLQLPKHAAMSRNGCIYGCVCFGFPSKLEKSSTTFQEEYTHNRSFGFHILVWKLHPKSSQ